MVLSICLFLLTGFAPYIKKVPAGLSPIISSTENAIVKIPIGVDEAYIRLASTATFHCTVSGNFAVVKSVFYASIYKTS